MTRTVARPRKRQQTQSQLRPTPAATLAAAHVETASRQRMQAAAASSCCLGEAAAASSWGLGLLARPWRPRPWRPSAAPPQTVARLQPQPPAQRLARRLGQAPQQKRRSSLQSWRPAMRRLQRSSIPQPPAPAPAGRALLQGRPPVCALQRKQACLSARPLQRGRSWREPKARQGLRQSWRRKRRLQRQQHPRRRPRRQRPLLPVWTFVGAVWKLPASASQTLPQRALPQQQCWQQLHPRLKQQASLRARSTLTHLRCVTGAGRAR